MSSRQRIVVFLGWIAAACLALATFVLSGLYRDSRTEADLARQQHAIDQVNLRLSQNQLEAERIVFRQELQDALARSTPAADAGAMRPKIILLNPATPTPAPAAIQAVLILDSAGRQGVFQAAQMPAPPAGQVYQLWLFTAVTDQPVGAGTFLPEGPAGAVRHAFTLTPASAGVTRWLVTLAPAPEGSAAPGPAVCSGG